LHSFSLLLVTVAVASAATPTRPNIVFIMAENPCYTDIAVYGSKYHVTLDMERLAAQGMRIANYHHCQNCTPTRAALMNGQYGARTGAYTVGSIDRFVLQGRPLRPASQGDGSAG
jgi:arylsulfatase A-like enzyme